MREPCRYARRIVLRGRDVFVSGTGIQAAAHHRRSAHRHIEIEICVYFTEVGKARFAQYDDLGCVRKLTMFDIEPSQTQGTASPRNLFQKDLSLALISELTRALEDEEIVYCHWKSNNALDRSARGENDLDLLVQRADAGRFAQIVSGLGFRQAEAPSFQAMPAVLDYYGYDEPSDRFVHLHVHYQLVVGHDATKNYRLPIERPYLESATRVGKLPTPAPEFEFVVFVARMVLKHSTLETILLRNGELSVSERREFAELQERVDRSRVERLLEENLPSVHPALFFLCVGALRPGSSVWQRVKAGRYLHKALEPHARRARLADTSLMFIRRFTGIVRRRLLKRAPKRHLASGGAMIAITGGDGSGKTTALEKLSVWLSEDFEVYNVHFGKPKWSLTTFLVRGSLRLGRTVGLYPYVSESSVLYSGEPEMRTIFPGYPLLIRLVCTARDRYLAYRRMRRLVTQGGLVLTDRFPFSTGELLDGPHVERVASQDRVNWLVGRLIELEVGHYKPILWPELLIVLELDPEIAVRRKTDEPEAYVRARSREMAAFDWQNTPARVVDASRSQSEVLRQLKVLIWSEL
jgi:thymidylate kinase